MKNSPIGSVFLGVTLDTLVAAATALCQSLAAEDLAKLKVSSGEHLAAILATAFLSTPPMGIEPDGGPDLVFDTSGHQENASSEDLLGVVGHPRASFEIKSLGGGFRKFDRSWSTKPGDMHLTTAVSVNYVIQTHGIPMIEKARMQLEKKAQSGQSRHIFLVSHPFDHLAVECIESPLIAHVLEPLPVIKDVDAVWVLFAPSHLVVWATARGKWTNLLLGGFMESAPPGWMNPEFSVLQDIESLFLELSGETKGSPYLFTLTTEDD